MNKKILLWQPGAGNIIPSSAKKPETLTKYAVQLNDRDKKQIIAAYNAGHFEMAITYLWGKTINALKKELSTVGITLLGEMLGKVDIDEDDDVDEILTTKETIKLAEELGIISPTDALRLRHTYELLTHFSQLDTNESAEEEIDESEAITSLKTCIKGVLGRPKVEVARKFIEFRETLERESLSQNDSHINMLKGSPYFFHKLTINVLMNAAKKNTGAQLEHALANINVLIPAIWANLLDSEKWQIGHTYAEAYSVGKTSTVSGLKSSLLKVKGFDFVPEDLRSDAFVAVAKEITNAHDGLNNFYHERSPVKKLAKLGSTIPAPALQSCITALMCVSMGNYFGVAWDAVEEAKSLLSKLTTDRWHYYLNNVFPSDTRILNKLLEDKPRSNWMDLCVEYNFDEVETKNNIITLLVKASVKKKDSKVVKHAKKILKEYYGQ